MVQLVADIRASAHFVSAWSLVATANDVVVGHVMASYVSLVDGETHDDTVRRIPSLSPLAVAPGSQRQGIGSALVRRLVELVNGAGEPLMVLEGSPRFYGRLGFEHSVPQGVEIELPHWAPSEAAQLVRLRNYDPAVRGRVLYPPAFAAVADAQQRHR